MHHGRPHATGAIGLAVATFWLLGTTAGADSIGIQYSTSMVIGDTGVTQGSESIGYIGPGESATVTTAPTGVFGATLNPAPVDAGTTMSLGALVPPVLPQSVIVGGSPGAGYQPTTYNNTPFYLTVTVNSVGVDAHAANPQSFTVDGYLNGALSAYGASSLTATFLRPNSVDSRLPPGTFASLSSGGYDTFLAIPSGTLSASNPNGMVSLSIAAEALTEFATPEPASWLAFGLLGLAQSGAIRWWNRRRRGQAG